MAPKKKILLMGGEGMFSYDFIQNQGDMFDIIPVSKKECDITIFESAIQCIAFHEPDILINGAAYTDVDGAEDIGKKECYEVNAIGAYNLARATSAFGVTFLTISTDYVFDGKKSSGYFPNDPCNPIGNYGMSKYLGEKLALQENPRTIIVRTGWLYGGKIGVHTNFVNTMLQLSETRREVTVVSDQYGIPTSSMDVSSAISLLLASIEESEGKIFHFTNTSDTGGISWADFARRIFSFSHKDIKVIDCLSSEYPTKALRPKWSVLHNTSSIVLPPWEESLQKYLRK